MLVSAINAGTFGYPRRPPRKPAAVALGSAKFFLASAPAVSRFSGIALRRGWVARERMENTMNSSLSGDGRVERPDHRVRDHRANERQPRRANESIECDPTFAQKKNIFSEGKLNSFTGRHYFLLASVRYQTKVSDGKDRQGTSRRPGGEGPGMVAGRCGSPRSIGKSTSECVECVRGIGSNLNGNSQRG